MLVAGCICLNESEFIGRNLAQHLPWVDKFVVVEGCDVHYPRRNVTEDGLSTDGTADIVRSFPDPDRRLLFIQHGFAGDGREGHGKVVLRDRYAQVMREQGWSGWFVHLDADEFYLARDQLRINAILSGLSGLGGTGQRALQLPTVHFWKTDECVVTGGYYSVQHTRFFRLARGIHYRWSDEGSHNYPRDLSGRYVHHTGNGVCRQPLALVQSANGARHDTAACYHYGFCKSEENMRDKTEYYEARGELLSRPKTAASRRAWFLRGSDVPVPGLAVHKWCGEVVRDGKTV